MILAPERGIIWGPQAFKKGIQYEEYELSLLSSLNLDSVTRLLVVCSAHWTIMPINLANILRRPPEMQASSLVIKDGVSDVVMTRSD